MQDFIQNVTSRLGLSQEQAQSAASSILNLLQQHLTPEEFGQLQEKLPGSDEVMQQAPSEAAPSEQPAGGPGGLVQSVLQTVGASGGATGAITGFLGKTGLNGSQISGFVSMFLDYLREKAGPGMVDKILQQVPGLHALSPMANAPS